MLRAAVVFDHMAACEGADVSMPQGLAPSMTKAVSDALIKAKAEVSARGGVIHSQKISIFSGPRRCRRYDRMLIPI